MTTEEHTIKQKKKENKEKPVRDQIKIKEKHNVILS